MSPANRTQLSRVTDADQDTRAIREIVNAHKDWFMSIDGRSPLDINADEFDFSVAHGRLVFSSWTESGSRAWRISAWNWNGERLLLDASRRLGAPSPFSSTSVGDTAREHCRILPRSFFVSSLFLEKSLPLFRRPELLSVEPPSRT